MIPCAAGTVRASYIYDCSIARGRGARLLRHRSDRSRARPPSYAPWRRCGRPRASVSPCSFLYGLRLWPAIVVGDLFLGDYSAPLGTVLGQTFGDTVALVAAALLMRRLTGGRCGLDRVADVLAFVTCALVAAVVSAAFGPLSLRLGDVNLADEVGKVVRTWTLGDAAGVLVVAPFMLTWATAGFRGLHRREVVEGSVVPLVLVALGAACRHSATCRMSSSRPVVGGRPIRAARGRHGHPRGLLHHGLEHGAERRAVRA